MKMDVHLRIGRKVQIINFLRDITQDWLNRKQKLDIGKTKVLNKTTTPTAYIQITMVDNAK